MSFGSDLNKLLNDFYVFLLTTESLSAYVDMFVLFLILCMYRHMNFETIGYDILFAITITILIGNIILTICISEEKKKYGTNKKTNDAIYSTNYK